MAPVLDAGTFQGTGFLPASGGTGAPGASGWTPVGVTFPQDMWVFVRTSGTVEYRINEKAKDTFCGLNCVDERPRFGQGEAGGDGVSPTSDALRVEVAAGSGGTLTQLLLAYSTVDGQREGLMRVRAGEQLYARRSGIPGGPSCLHCDPVQPYVPWYVVSGGTTLTATKANPLQVRAGAAAGTPESPIAFTAVALDGVSGLSWTYVTNAGEHQQVPAECRGQPACSYGPSAPGRMRVTGRWRDLPVDLSAFSDSIKVQEPELVLTCNGVRAPAPLEVPRGQSVACAVSTGGGVSLADVKWSFTSAEVPPPIVITGPSGARGWSGQIVVSGAISVTSNLEGKPFSAAVPISVIPRRWQPIILEPADFGQGPLPLHPTKHADLAITYVALLKHPIDVSRVEAGPNSGWWYVRTPVSRFVVPIYISAALRPGSDFAQLQKPGQINGVPTCTQADIPMIRQLAEEHEGLTTGPLRSHVAAYQAYFDKAKPERLLERAIAHESQLSEEFNFFTKVGGVTNFDIANAGYNDPTLKHLPGQVGGHPDGTVPLPSYHCTLRFFGGN